MFSSYCSKAEGHHTLYKMSPRILLLEPGLLWRQGNTKQECSGSALRKPEELLLSYQHAGTTCFVSGHAAAQRTISTPHFWSCMLSPTTHVPIVTSVPFWCDFPQDW